MNRLKITGLKLHTYPSAPPPLDLQSGRLPLCTRLLLMPVVYHNLHKPTISISKFLFKINVISLITLCYVFTLFYKNTFQSNHPCILCKTVCILRVYYMYITCNLSPSLMYKPLTLLHFHASGKTQKPYTFAFSCNVQGSQFLNNYSFVANLLAHALSEHSSSTRSQCLCGFCFHLYIMGILPTKSFSILYHLTSLQAFCKYADEQNPVLSPYTT